jgi:lysozyme family protein
MDSYDICLEKLKILEGGFVNDPNDAGGATKWGMSLSFLKKLADVDKDGFVDGDLDRDGDVDIDDINHLTLEDYERIIKVNFWDVQPQGTLAGKIKLQFKLLEMGVHASPLIAMKTLQYAAGLSADGVVGIQTLKAIRDIPEDTLVSRFKYHQLRYYNKCIINRPKNFAFMANWTWRAHQEL